MTTTVSSSFRSASGSGLQEEVAASAAKQGKASPTSKRDGLFYFGEDAARVFWILQSFSDPGVKLIDSSMTKEWELLQVVSSFLLAGGIASSYFASSSTPQWGQEAYTFIAGLIMMLLFSVLLSTTLCRMFLSGQWTMLVADSRYFFKNPGLRPANRNWDAALSKQAFYNRYWTEVHDDMKSFSEVVGLISSVSKGVLLVAIFLWMALTVMATRRSCSDGSYWVTAMVGAIAGVVGIYFVFNLITLLRIAKRNARHGPAMSVLDAQDHKRPKRHAEDPEE